MDDSNPFQSPSDDPQPGSPAPPSLSPRRPVRRRLGAQSRDFANVSFVMKFIGFGLGAYHRWAWYGAVVILLPMTIVVSLASMFAAALDPIYLFVVCLWPIFCGYVAWVLMSQGGRRRYFETYAATARAKQDPDSLAGRRFR